MDDAVFIDLMADLWGGDPNGDLWEIALLDDGPEPEFIDPRMEARCLRDAARDVLSGSLWWETGEAEDRQGRHWEPHYREAHPFPVDIDPDEEKPW